MKITGLRNNKTGEVIYSRAHHDYHSDKSGEIFVDGGFEYLRCGWKEGADFSTVQFELDVDKKTLYDDWNQNKNKYGSLSKYKIKKYNIEIKEINPKN